MRCFTNNDVDVLASPKMTIPFLIFENSSKKRKVNISTAEEKLRRRCRWKNCDFEFCQNWKNATYAARPL